MSAPTGCAELRPLLAGYLDGELSPAERAEVSEHLAACAACAQELADAEEVAAWVHEAGAPPEPDAAAWAAFDRGLAAALQREAPPPAAVPPWFRPLLVAVAAAAALLGSVWVAGWVLETPTALADPRLPVFYVEHTDPRLPTGESRPVLPPLDAVEGFEAARAVLPEEAVAILASHGVVQVPSAFEGPADAYPPAVPPGAPAPLVTADAALLLYGGAASRAAVALEEAVIVPGLRHLLELLGRELAALRREGRTGAVRRGARLAHERIAIAALLVGADPHLAPDERHRFEAEATRVREAKEVARTPFPWGERIETGERVVDYREFRPRGIYAGSEALRDHARAARWLSKRGLRLDPGHEEEARAACLTVLALARGRLDDGRTGLGLQARLEAALEVVYGEPDELTPLDLLVAIQQALGRTAVKPSDLAADSAVAAVIARASAQAEARGTGQVRSLGGDPSRLVLLGNTRSVEGRVLSRLTSPNVLGRSQPTSLDLLALLGSRLARTIVSVDTSAGAEYQEQLRRLEPAAAVWRDPAVPVPVAWTTARIPSAVPRTTWWTTSTNRRPLCRLITWPNCRPGAISCRQRPRRPSRGTFWRKARGTP